MSVTDWQICIGSKMTALLLGILLGLISAACGETPTNSRPLRPQVSFSLAKKVSRNLSDERRYVTRTDQAVSAVGADSAGLYIVAIQARETVSLVAGQRPDSEIKLIWVANGIGEVSHTTSILPCSNPYADPCADRYIDPQHEFHILGFQRAQFINDSAGILLSGHMLGPINNDDQFVWSRETPYAIIGSDSSTPYLVGTWKSTSDSRKDDRGWIENAWLYHGTDTIIHTTYELKCSAPYSSTDTCLDSYSDPGVRFNIFGSVQFIPFSQDTLYYDSSPFLFSRGNPEINISGEYGWTMETSLPLRTEHDSLEFDPLLVISLASEGIALSTGEEPKREIETAWIQDGQGKLRTSSYAPKCNETSRGNCLEEGMDPQHSFDVLGFLPFFRVNQDTIEAKRE